MRATRNKKNTSKPVHQASNLPARDDVPSKVMSVDLHYFSEKQAQECVLRTIKNASYDHVERIRFVTGRGNHINAQGNRGTLYNNFNAWLDEVKGQQLVVHQFDGFYEVDIRKNIPVRNPLHALLNDSIKFFLQQNINIIKKGAENGCEEDLLALAICYHHGLGVKQDYKESATIYEQLAVSGSVIAQYEIGCSYFIGRGVRQNDVTARKFLAMAAAQDYSLAELLLGNIYWKGIGTPVDYVQAVKYHRDAAKHGQAEGARKLGCAYHDGRGVDVDFDQAITWWEQASELGDCVAAYNLSVIYHTNDRVKNTQKAFTYMQRSANLGDPDGMRDVAFAFFQGNYTKKDIPSALSWFQKAVDHGSADAMYFLFQYYLHHPQEGKNPQTYLTNAAEADHIMAQLCICAPTCPFEFAADFKAEVMNKLLKHDESTILDLPNIKIIRLLIELHLCEDNSKRQRKKGANMLRKLAQDNCPQALQQLGEMHIHGDIVKRSPEQARSYWLQGAKLGDATCLCSLGYFWDGELGGKPDAEKANDYFKQAAEKGSANAHNKMGLHFKEEKDYRLAEHHFKQAMELDHPEKRNARTQNVFKHAAYNLAMLYWHDGEILGKSKEEAVLCFHQSAMDGFRDAARFLISYHYGRDELLKALEYLPLVDNIDPAVLDVLKSFCTPPSNTPAPSPLPTQGKISSHGIFSSAAQNKKMILVELEKISQHLETKLEWNFTKNNSVWAYVSEEMGKKLSHRSHSEGLIRKTKAGRYIILIEDTATLLSGDVINKLSGKVQPIALFTSQK